MDLFGATETVTADRYMNVLTRFWLALGRFCGHEARGQQWFMQDGPLLLTWLTDHLEGRVISRFTEKTWASHSPDLNPLDCFFFFFFGGGGSPQGPDVRRTISNFK